MSEHDSAYRTEGIYDKQTLVDVRVIIGTRSYRLLGPAGAAREETCLSSLPDATGPDYLPVLLGSGMGYGLNELVRRLDALEPDLPLAVVDKEAQITSLTGSRDQCRERYGERLLWLDDADQQNVLRSLTKWQETHGGKRLLPLLNPAYLRLDRLYYASLNEKLTASAQVDFWSRTRYPRFTGEKPRILLLTRQYFLIGEFIAACQRLDIPHHLVTVPDVEVKPDVFVQLILEAVTAFKPDFVLTINHLGVDREGLLIGLLDRLNLPLASWFVDNPHLVLGKYSQLVTSKVAIFTWDLDNLPSLAELGYTHVFYLPLGTDEQRFVPRPAKTCAASWKADISFVANSMVHKTRARQSKLTLSDSMVASLEEVAAAFAESEERSVRSFLFDRYPKLIPEYDDLPGEAARLDFEVLLTWSATLGYRLTCVKGILAQRPLIAGDDGWISLLGKPGRNWRWHSELSYYDELPSFYTCSLVNFNCTSKQMKGAVNQRVFDVPATGSFLLTDWSDQIADLFEPGKEVICFHNPDQAGELAAKYLTDKTARRRIASAARRRVLAEHTYSHRIRSLIATMRQTFA